MNSDLSNLLIGPDASIRDAASCLDRSARGIVLVVKADKTLLNTITDGDIRRAMLAGVNLDGPINQLLQRKADSPYREPVTAPADTERPVLLQIMQERNVRQVPLLDDGGRVVDLVTLPELLPDEVLPIEAVIMAGGYGTRLMPLTKELPKPMLPIGDRPLMQVMIEQLRQAGIRTVNVMTHYQQEKITDYFGDGKAFGVEMRYVAEDQPLGTAGGLGLIKTQNDPILVVNGDILTRVDFRAMLEFHRNHKADITVAVRQYDVQLPYGVLECENQHVRKVREKPLLNFFVNAGIYLIEPSMHRYIPNEQSFDMTDLIQRLLDDGRSVVSFPILEYWLDIGQHQDYEQAQKDLRDGELSLT
jgi:dTDP-glucose pyrophosphorylase